MNSLTKNLSNKKRIIWAVDPSQNPQDAKNIIKELKIWAKRLDCSVLPVTVFPKSIFDFPVNITDLSKKGVEIFAYESTNRYLKNTGVKGFLPPHVLFAKNISNRTMAWELSKYSEKINASVTFVNTYAKKTWNPLRLGGFAETLIVTSRTPILVLNQSALPSSQFSTVLFPMDFSRESKTALTRFKPWAQSFKSKVLIYNQVALPTLFVPSYLGFIPPIDGNSLLESAEKIQVKNAKRLSDELKGEGIPCETIVQQQQKSVATGILDLAIKRNVDLIALANRSGPLSRAFLGSTARDVLLQAQCPVLIFHRPKAIRKNTTKTQQALARRPSRQVEISHEAML